MTFFVICMCMKRSCRKHIAKNNNHGISESDAVFKIAAFLKFLVYLVFHCACIWS